MNRFAALFAELDSTIRTTPKVAALARYISGAPLEDRLWTVALFSGRRPKRIISATKLALWAAEAAQIPDWLFTDAYAVAGDLAETISLILPDPAETADLSLAQWIAELQRLSTLEDDARHAGILAAWNRLGGTERFLFSKLLTGGFRVGVSQTLMTRAIAQATGQDAAQITHRLMGDWTPATTTWDALIAGTTDTDLPRPSPFCLAYPLDTPDELRNTADWLAERK